MKRDHHAARRGATDPVVITTPRVLPTHTANLASSLQFAIAGLPPHEAVSMAVTSGSLPPGLTLSPTGLLSGTPTTAGTYTFQITTTHNHKMATSFDAVTDIDSVPAWDV